jgi:hypothetical protein
MAHLEQEKLSFQLNDSLSMLNELKRLQTLAPSMVAAPGSAVQTNNGNFFISAGIGKLMVKGTEWFAISSTSPLGAVLLNNPKGATLKFNGREYQILQIN